VRTAAAVLVLAWLVVSTAPAVDALAHSSQSSPGGRVYVHGYVRKDGSYVEPHLRAPATPHSGTTSPRRYSIGNGSSPLFRSPSLRMPAPPRVQDAPVIPRSRSTRVRTPSQPWDEAGTYRDGRGILRNADGRIHRSEAERLEFMKRTGYPHGRPGYVIDHIKPLSEGGADDPSNMQWQSVEEAKAKDKVERSHH
jgi:hypothetical protein